MKHIAILIWVLALGTNCIVGQPAEPLDFQKARQLIERRQRGETLSTEEKAYLDRARAARNAATHPASQRKPPERFTPLTDMGAAERYEGEDGGLYGEGRNTPAQAQRQAAQTELAK